MVDLLVKDGIIVTQNNRREILKGSLVIEKGRISDIGETHALLAKHKPQEIVDASGKIILPGLINAHVHSSSLFFRGFVDDKSVYEISKDPLWIRIHRQLEHVSSKDSLFQAALLTYLEGLKCGTTFACEVSRSKHQATASIEAMHRLGIRGMTCSYETEGIDEITEQGRQYGILVGLGLHTEDRMTADDLEERREVAATRGLTLHMHVGETPRRVEAAKTAFGKTPIEVLEEFGLLNSRLIMSHAVWLSDTDIDAVMRNQAKVVTLPTSNMKLSSGIAPVVRYLERGITVGLGTDGAAYNNCNDMFREMKTACLSQKLNYGPQALGAQQALDMATIEGAKVFNMDGETGSIELEKRADLVLLDALQPHMKPLVLGPKANLVSNIVYCATGQDVCSVIVRGRILVRERRVEHIDELDLMQRIDDWTTKMFAEEHLT